MKRRDEEFGFEEKGIILALWRLKLDTVAIARQLGCHEHEVANRLLHLRNERRCRWCNAVLDDDEGTICTRVQCTEAFVRRQLR